MSDMKLGGLAFDRGIDRVTYARQDTATMLPERGEAAPPDVGSRPQLDALLSRPSLDDGLEEAIRPQLENRDLLAPARFRQALDGALAQLRETAERMQPAAQAAGNNTDTGTDTGTEQLRLVNRAARLLNEECGLRDLLQMYRSVLYQG
jgi:type III secretion protein X